MAYHVVLNALGDPTRRQIFDRLRHAPSSVAALADGLPISRPAVSQHLKILKDAGLVTDQAQGARRIYRVDYGGLGDLRAWLDGFLEEARGVYEAEIQKQIDERKST
jgi:DNA-binding transcriptional ArsR family regulator